MFEIVSPFFIGFAILVVWALLTHLFGMLFVSKNERGLAFVLGLVFQFFTVMILLVCYYTGSVVLTMLGGPS